MIQSNKILTVSYGTFSCTLEGFEDNFDTMKAIAEYFRDLAADDRYFGAEPPTPDADMLARIAEREIARRVEAHMDEQGILLRAAPAAVANASPARDAEMAEGAPHVAAQAEAADPAPQVATPSTDAEAEHVAENDETASSGMTAALATGAVAAAATGLAAFVQNAPDGEADEAVAPQDALTDARAHEVLDALHADGLVDDIAAPAPELAEEIVEDVTDPDEDVSLDVADQTDDVVDEDLAGDADIETDAAAAPQGDSIADKLARIRAVVSGDDTAADGYVEDEDVAVQPVAHDDEDEVAQALELQPEASSASVEEPIEDNTSDPEPAAEAQLEEEPSPVAAPTPKAPVRVVRVKRGPRRAPEAAKPQEAAAQTPLVLAEQNRVAEDDDMVDGGLSPEDEDDLMRELAEVEAEMTGAEESPVDEPALLEEDHEDTPVARDPEPEENVEADDAPSAEVADFDDDLEHDTAQPDEDALQSAVARAMSPETAEPKTEGASSQPPADMGYEDEDEAPQDPSIYKSIKALTRRVRLAESGGKAQDQDVSRLMAETQAQMEEPEGRSRRSAIAHLRAAVAATREERKTAAPGQEAPSREAQFREDLDAVRPRAEEGETKRAAPLKLVAEQRVDSGEAGAEAEALSVEADPTPEAAASVTMRSVRPRRVSRRNDDDVTQAPTAQPSGSFLAYAEDIGANGLPELLEAAAAYMTMVEKRPQFSRPQLMRKIREVEAADFSREDRLRYFGQLLREGKIEKTASGRFTAAPSIGFQPGERAAG